MPETLLRTKLVVPPLRPSLVPRPQLIERLNEALQLGHKLTLVSAPAGFGKTTLANVWVQQTERPITWLSLDENDNDPARFLAYLVAALNRVAGIGATIGRGALDMLQSPQPPPSESVLTSLINDVTAVSEGIIFILDDYHLIDSSPVDDALTFLLEHLPPQMHLVIATREDPRLPLSRLRARGELTELRAADLRFTSSEAAEFLNRVMGLALSEESVKALETRTEGWIAGLQLAAISLRGREDTTRLIESFSGSHRLVLDYLMEEVLEQQPESVQTFLLQTAILNRLTGSLCDALRFGDAKSPTGQEDGQAILEMLENANLFIVPLDEERRWYRYHHLFADLLRQRLCQNQPERVPTLHTQASKWYQQNGFVDEAIEHALQGKAFERAANLIAEEAEAAWERNEEITLRRWLDRLPEALVFSMPQLWIFHAWSLFITGQRKSAEQMLENIEQALDQGAKSNKDLVVPESIQLDKNERMKLQGRIETTRAYISFFQGDEQEIITRTQRALDYLPIRDLSWRSMVSNSLADAYYFLGDMTKAYETRLQALEVSKAAGNSYQIMLANLKLAVTLRKRGELQSALEICQQEYRIANELGMSETVVAGWLLTIWGEALAEMNHLKPAIEKALKGVELTEKGGDVATLGWSYVWLIRVLFSNGDLGSAEQIVRKMEKTVRELDMLPWIMDALAGWKTRIWLKQDKLDDAILWVKEQKLDTDGEITSVNEAAYNAFARILLAQDQLDESLNLLQRLWEPAKTGRRTSIMLEILILQALNLQAGENAIQATNKLEEALILAEPGGFIRIFVDEGPPMAHLLYEALNRGIAPDYVRRLLAAFPVDEPMQADLKRTEADQSELVEPLSDRELEVLQLIAEGLTNREIASRLYISLHTVKAHSRNIYGKLDVHNRTRAVSQARALGILPPL